MFALAKTISAVAPHGTCAWHSATFTPVLARSLTDVTCAGFDGGTATSMTFFTKVVGSAASPDDTTSSMFVVLADAKTSAGAPSSICSASPELGPKLKTTFTPGWAASNCFPRVVNASVNDDAAETLMVPVIAVFDGEPSGAVLPPDDDPPHAVAATMTRTTTAAATASPRTSLRTAL